jgi:hypothetical protein
MLEEPVGVGGSGLKLKVGLAVSSRLPLTGLVVVRGGEEGGGGGV